MSALRWAALTEFLDELPIGHLGGSLEWRAVYEDVVFFWAPGGATAETANSESQMICTL